MYVYVHIYVYTYIYVYMYILNFAHTGAKPFTHDL